MPANDTASAYVILSDTFDQWRMKTNEWLSMTNSAGSSNFLKTNDVTNSTSNTTGSITTAGGMGIGASAVIGGDLTIFGDVDVDGTLNFDASDIDGAWQIDATVTVGVDDTGHDVKFFGATSGAYMIWDESANDLEFAGVSAVSIDTTTDSSNTTTGSFHTDGGVGIAKKLYVGTDLDVDGTSNLDEVDIDDTVQIDNTVTVGVNENSANVKFFGATSGSYMLWQEDADDLVLAGASALSIDNTTDATNTTSGSFHTDGGVGIAKKLYVGTDLDVNGTTNLDAVDIDSTTQIDNTVSVGTNGSGFDVKFFGATSGNYWQWDASADKVIQVGSTQLTGAVTVGVDDTGHDVKFFGASAGAFMLYDQSEDTLEIRGPSADATTSTGKLLLSTSLTNINDGDILGSIGFKAPLEAGSSDAILVGASIHAEADATFSSSVNSTDLVFSTGDSDSASEKMRIDSTGQVTFADGAIDVDIASHDGTNGLKLGGTLIKGGASFFNGMHGVGKAAALAIVFA